MFGIFDKIVDEIDEFIDDPLNKTVDVATQPMRDGLDILDGLTEGEIREKAALRLGTDVVAGMALSEIIEYLMSE